MTQKLHVYQYLQYMQNVTIDKTAGFPYIFKIKLPRVCYDTTKRKILNFQIFLQNCHLSNVVIWREKDELSRTICTRKVFNGLSGVLHEGAPETACWNLIWAF